MNANVTELSVSPATTRSATVPGLAGSAVTVIAAAPICPSLEAVIVTEPAATPVATPVPLTVATAVLVLAQVTSRPVSGLPFASCGVAVSCTVRPAVTLADAGLTATEATGTVVTTVTVTAAVPLCPSLVAVMVAVPAATPLTSPLPLTVATAAVLVAHITTRPLSELPLASFGVAVSCTVCPTGALAEDGLTVTDATGTAVTVTALESAKTPPSTLAVT